LTEALHFQAWRSLFTNRYRSRVQFELVSRVSAQSRLRPDYFRGQRTRRRSLDYANHVSS
jgi:hypothetical protein